LRIADLKTFKKLSNLMLPKVQDTPQYFEPFLINKLNFKRNLRHFDRTNVNIETSKLSHEKTNCAFLKLIKT
jgi:hypothetical protein